MKQLQVCSQVPPIWKGVLNLSASNVGSARASSPLLTSRPCTWARNNQTVSTLHTCPREQNRPAQNLPSGDSKRRRSYLFRTS